jgi:hypothetical protein
MFTFLQDKTYKPNSKVQNGIDTLWCSSLDFLLCLALYFSSGYRNSGLRTVGEIY